MKFTIRDLFLVTMIVALAVGWWVDHRRLRLGMEEIHRAAIHLEYVLGGSGKGYTIPSPQDF